MSDRAEINRAAKAGAIAEVLRQKGFTADQALAVSVDEQVREAVEWLAFRGTKRTASVETWDAAIAILRGAETVPDITDPFAGLPGC